MNGYLFHPEAELDLLEIWEFVADHSMDAADALLTEITATLSLAVSMPHKGHRRADLTARPLRFLHVQDYVIAYAAEKPLWIVAIVHGRRNPRVLAAVLQGRQ